MKIVNVHEAKTHLSRLLSEVGTGQEIVIAKAGKPMARLVPIGKKAKKRRPGSAKGKVILADSFLEPMPEDMLEAFEK